MPINADNGQNNQNDDQNQQNGQQNNPVTLTGSGQAQPSTAGRVAGFSSGQPQQAGSGRFTNLSKYMSANQGAGERIGSQIQNQVNRNVDTKTSNISDQNQKIRQGIDAGKASNIQGNQFNTQLGGINSNLKSFNNMEDRAGFDQGAKDAQAFTQAPNFNQFQNIQAGQGVDENALNQGQGQAQVAGQDLSKLTGNNINRIGTEQGRYELLRNRFAPGGRSYAAGNARLDQALLQNAPGNVVGQMRNQFVNQNNASSALNNNINAQGQDVNTVVKDESNLLNNLNNVTQSNQDIFNEKLGQKGNIDYINDLRQKKYDEYLNQLKTGNVGQEVSNELGLNQLNTYKPVGSGEMQAFGMPNQTSPRSLTQYNADLTNNAQNYLKKGQVAGNMQDIATDNDYAGYQALANIAKRDTGKLSGASQLDRAVQGTTNSNGQTLADVIGGYDQNFKDKYAGKNFSNYSMGRTGADDKGNFLENAAGSAINSIVNLPQNGVDLLHGVLSGNGSEALSSYGNGMANLANTVGTLGAGNTMINNYNVDKFNKQLTTPESMGLNPYSEDDYTKFRRDNYQTTGGAGVSASDVNLDDYLKNGASSIRTQGTQGGRNLNSSAANSRQAVENAMNQSKNNLTSGLDRIIGDTGVKNNININQDDSQNQTLQRAKRFSRLV